MLVSQKWVLVGLRFLSLVLLVSLFSKSNYSLCFSSSYPIISSQTIDSNIENQGNQENTYSAITSFVEQFFAGYSFHVSPVLEGCFLFERGQPPSNSEAVVSSPVLLSFYCWMSPYARALVSVILDTIILACLIHLSGKRWEWIAIGWCLSPISMWSVLSKSPVLLPTALLFLSHVAIIQRDVMIESLLAVLLCSLDAQFWFLVILIPLHRMMFNATKCNQKQTITSTIRSVFFVILHASVLLGFGILLAIICGAFMEMPLQSVLNNILHLSFLDADFIPSLSPFWCTLTMATGRGAFISSCLMIITPTLLTTVHIILLRNNVSASIFFARLVSFFFSFHAGIFEYQIVWIYLTLSGCWNHKEMKFKRFILIGSLLSIVGMVVFTFQWLVMNIVTSNPSFYVSLLFGICQLFLMVEAQNALLIERKTRKEKEE
eukprot:TRINITY_DN80470_c0_g1_i2.p1 TRINITY_DN80470_c0_g1~~TRINITY_DN80470_c0_g1_i2.p1  ORF type:complete len:433 (+),score=64.21 TRINITY_DN80470_c0_g1_i2:109-1407(+)